MRGECLVDSALGKGGAHGVVSLGPGVAEGASGLCHDVYGWSGLLVGARSYAEGDKLPILCMVLGVSDELIGLVPAGAGVGEEVSLVGKGVLFEGGNDDIEDFAEEGAVVGRVQPAVGFF